MPEMKELGIVRIASPCHTTWSAMIGDEQVRVCARCNLDVYDLSSLGTDDARALLQKTERRLCVRFWARKDGTVMTSDCPIGARRRTWKLAVMLIAAATVVIFAVLAVIHSERRTCGLSGDPGVRRVWSADNGY